MCKMKKFEIVFLLFSVVFSGMTILFVNEITKGTYGCVFPAVCCFFACLGMVYAHLDEREENER